MISKEPKAPKNKLSKRAGSVVFEMSKQEKLKRMSERINILKAEINRLKTKLSKANKDLGEAIIDIYIEEQVGSGSKKRYVPRPVTTKE